MATYDYKLTMDYKGALVWRVSIFRREILVNRERGAWACILSIEAPTLEGHVDANERFRQVLRSLSR